MIPIKNPCADLIKTRHAAGLNQTEFWGRVGLKQSTGCRYERERRKLPTPVAMLIEIAYGTAGDKVIAKLRQP